MVTDLVDFAAWLYHQAVIIMWRLIQRTPKPQGMLATLKRPRVGRPVVVPGAIARGDTAVRAFRVTVPGTYMSNPSYMDTVELMDEV